MERYGPCLIVSGAQNADGTWKDDSSYGASMRRFFNGVILPKLPSPYNTETLYGATLQCGVDGLAKATLLCTKKSVSATTVRPCCDCNVESSQRHIVYDFYDPECPLKLTTMLSHQRDQELVREQQHPTTKTAFSKYLGVSEERHAFEGIVPEMPFNYIQNTPYDHGMHGEAEGVFKDGAKLMLKDVFKSTPSSEYYHPISLNGSEGEVSFNTLLSTFDFPEEDKDSTPHRLKPVAIEGDGSIPWSACMMLTFAFHSIAMMSPHVNKHDPVWMCWCMHVYYVAFAWKNSFTWEETVHLNVSIRKHHTLFVQLYPDDVIPKFHWVLHLPHDIWQNGPPKHISCMRMEAKHRFWKRLISQLNFKGCLPEILGCRYARHTALMKYMKPITSSHIQPMGASTENTCHSGSQFGLLLLTVESLANAIRPNSMITYTTHTKLKWTGQILKEGCILSFEEHPGQHLSVGCVHEIVVVDGHHLLTFYKFASGLIDIDGQKGVCLSSLESSINAIELNTCSLTIAKGFTQLDHDDVLVLVV